jgi:predicted nucleic acid-binding protein
MIVLHTDTLGILQRASGEQFERLSSRLQRATDWPPLVTIVTFEEQMRGWLHATNSGFRCSRDGPVSAACSAEDPHRDHGLLRIAAIVIANDAKLIWRNLVDFDKVPGLVVEDWAG